MKHKNTRLVDQLSSGFWFIPMVVTCGVVGVSLLAIITDYFGIIDWLFGDILPERNLDYYRDFLSVMVGAVITMVTVTFSITILILWQVSNQLGRQLLQTFMKQKATQIIIGIYLATFTFGMLSLYLFSFLEVIQTRPFATVTLALILSIISVFALIYHISFVCHAIRLETVLRFLREDACQCLLGYEKNSISHSSNYLLLDKKHYYSKHKHHYHIKKQNGDAGYIVSIDYDFLLNFAEKNNCLIHVLVKPGRHILINTPVITVLSEKEMGEPTELEAAIEYSQARNSHQDFEFCLEQISEVGVRSLSPSTNDPYAAIKVIDTLFEVFSCVASMPPIPHVMLDNEKNPRVFCETTTTDNILRSAFRRFALDMKKDECVLEHFFEKSQSFVNANPDCPISASVERVRKEYLKGNYSHKLDNEK